MSTSTTTQKAADVGLDPRSVLGLVFEKRPFVGQQVVYGTYQISQSGSQGTEITLVELGMDIGNSGTRTAVLHQQQHTMEFTQTPATYEDIPSLVYGEKMETWQERYFDDRQRDVYAAQFATRHLKEMPPQYSEVYSIGEYADASKSLPIGGTDLRLADARYDRYGKACLVRGLIAGGYPPGHYYLSLAMGVRNEELTITMGVDPEVQKAIDAFKRPFTLIRNGKEEWTVEIRECVVLPQTFGTYYALNTGIFGQALSDIPHWTVLDLGYYDGHILEVFRSKGMQVTAQKVATGTVDVARGLVLELRKAQNFPLVSSDLSDAEAIEILHSEKLLIGGVALQNPDEDRRATSLIQGYKAKQGGTLIATMTSRHTRLDSKFAFTGGGNAEFIPQIQTAMRAAHRPDHLYQVVPPQVARFANVSGLYWVLNIRKRPLTVAR